MSKKKNTHLDEVMTHQDAFVSLDGSNEEDLMKAANAAKKEVNKGKK